MEHFWYWGNLPWKYNPIVRVEDILEIIEEVLFSSHADIHPPVVSDVNHCAGSATNRKKEKKNWQKDADFSLIFFSIDPGPMENIDVSMESNDYRKVPIKCSCEHVVNTFNQAD